MKIVLNGAWRDLPASGAQAAAETHRPALPLDRVLGLLGFTASTVATALNGEFVPAGSRGQTPVQEGDRLEVLAPMQGG